MKLSAKLTRENGESLSVQFVVHGIVSGEDSVRAVARALKNKTICTFSFGEQRLFCVRSTLISTSIVH